MFFFLEKTTIYVIFFFFFSFMEYLNHKISSSSYNRAYRREFFIKYRQAFQRINAGFFCYSVENCYIRILYFPHSYVGVLQETRNEKQSLDRKLNSRRNTQLERKSCMNFSGHLVRITRYCDILLSKERIICMSIGKAIIRRVILYFSKKR